MRTVYSWLNDILRAIERIEREAAKGRDRFLADDLIQTWVMYHLQVIGEASRAGDDELSNLTPDVDWRRIQRFRNVLVHRYFGIDLDEVWGFVESDLPAIKASIERALGSQKP